MNGYFSIYFPVLVRMFGTYFLPGNEWLEATELNESHYPNGYFKQFVYPFPKTPIKMS